MKKIELTQSERDSIKHLLTTGGDIVKIIEKIFDFYIADLRDIDNIDPEGNMGLQSLARQHAWRAVEGIKCDILSREWPDEKNKKNKNDKKISQWA